MAQLLSPVCTDVLKLQNPFQRISLNTRCRMLAYSSSSFSCGMTGKRRIPGRIRAAATTESFRPDADADDYYSVLGLLPDATPEQIKKAYYSCMKACHPDLSGNDPETTNFCMFVNDVYEVLSDPVQRRVYDEIHGYALTAINPFLDDSSVKDHVFVDEFSCIGCKNCANVAPDVFGIEEDHGRARAYKQCGKSDEVEQAIESCPVDCIYWTSAAQLSLLEDEMRRVERVNVLDEVSKHDSHQTSTEASENPPETNTNVMVEQEFSDFVSSVITGQPLTGAWLNKSVIRRVEGAVSGLQVALMLSGMGSSADVFRMANSRWEKRQAKILDQARYRMMKQEGSGKDETYWGDIWSKSKDYESKENEAGERTRRAAAAARRWREYSRKGADKPPKYKLPEAISTKE